MTGENFLSLAGVIVLFSGMIYLFMTLTARNRNVILPLIVIIIGGAMMLSPMIESESNIERRVWESQ